MPQRYFQGPEIMLPVQQMMYLQNQERARQEYDWMNRAAEAEKARQLDRELVKQRWGEMMDLEKMRQAGAEAAYNRNRFAEATDQASRVSRATETYQLLNEQASALDAEANKLESVTPDERNQLAEQALRLSGADPKEVALIRSKAKGEGMPLENYLGEIKTITGTMPPIEAFQALQSQLMMSRKPMIQQRRIEAENIRNTQRSILPYVNPSMLKPKEQVKPTTAVEGAKQPLLDLGKNKSKASPFTGPVEPAYSGKPDGFEPGIFSGIRFMNPYDMPNASARPMQVSPSIQTEPAMAWWNRQLFGGVPNTFRGPAQVWPAPTPAEIQANRRPIPTTWPFSVQAQPVPADPLAAHKLPNGQWAW